MRTGFLVTARLKSTRLPRKALLPLCGRPVLAHLLDRAKACRSVEVVIVCTSTNPEDDPLVDLARAEGVASFRGDEDDVLARLSGATQEFRLDYALSATADCPLVEPGYADAIVAASEATGADLIRALDLPHGAYGYGIRPDALRRAVEIKDDRQTEVWGRYFTDTDLFRVHDLWVEPRHRRPDLRLTLDYPEDLDFLGHVFERLYRPGETFTLDAVLELLDRHPELVNINRHCAAAYRKRWAEQAEVRLKPRHAVRRAAIVGCGSIGRRHLRNLRALGLTDIVALRTRQGHLKDLDPSLGVREETSWQTLEESPPDVAIVSNPTSLHLETARRLVPHVRGIFIEKPLAASLPGVLELLREIEVHRRVSFVGYSLEFHPLVQALRALLASGKLGRPLLLQCQVGQWLPDWHPSEDYRTAYFARRDLGGGAARTLCHELRLARSLLGPVRAVAAVFPPSELLPLDVDVIADVQLQHDRGGVSQVHLDFLQRPPQRSGVVSCERGWARYDLVASRIVAHAEDQVSAATAWEGTPQDLDQAYVEEMSTFLRCVREGRVRHALDARNAAHEVALVDAAEQAAASGSVCELPAWTRPV